MAYPSPDAHRTKTGRGLEVQTDKDKFKIVPCTYAGCTTDLVVNTFYAPFKAKCSQHSGNSRNAVAASHLTHSNPDKPAAPNGALGNLLCPLCSMPLMIKNMSEDGGFITFRCSEGYASTIKESQDPKTRRCGTSVQIRLNWAGLEMNDIPTKFADLVREFNLDQAVKYFDIKEDRND